MAEAKEIFEAKSLSVQQVLGESGTGFYIPAYQRPFAWKDEAVRKLLRDLLVGFQQLDDDEGSFAFLGTIIFVHDTDYKTISPLVRQSVPPKVLNVIDGQQRLSTLIGLTIALHSQIASRTEKLKLGSKSSSSETLSWLWDQSSEVLGYLEDCFRFQKIKGRDYYPRMIRAFDDQWSDDAPIYTSAIAALTSGYSNHLDTESHGRFTVREKNDLFDRYRAILRYLDSLASEGLKAPDSDEIDVTENVSLDSVLRSSGLQKALLGFPILEDVASSLQDAEAPLRELAILIFYANFVLKRVALVAVEGKNEQYAFEVFESLNTTGEPLTAYETFTPRVVRAEGLEGYGTSKSKGMIDRITNSLVESGNRIAPKRTSEMLIQFALVEYGEKLSGTLTSQRRFLQRKFSLIEADGVKRESFLHSLESVANFLNGAWHQAGESPSLDDLTPGNSAEFTVALRALGQMNHSIALAPIIRYYDAARPSNANASHTTSGEVFEVAATVVAFSVLWRAFTGGTGGIDSAYRDLMKSSGDWVGLARNATLETPPLEAFRARLREVLLAKIESRERWLRDAIKQPLYKHKSIARLVLLGAYHGSVVDMQVPGLIAKGKQGVNQFMTPEGLARPLSLEHVAPQKPEKSGQWDVGIYSDATTIDSIGNLVLLPTETNSILGNRSWSFKSILYGALGAPDEASAEARLAELTEQDLLTDRAEIAAARTYLPQLEAIGERGQSGLPWDREFIEERGERLLGLAWDYYSPFLGQAGFAG